MKHIPTMNQVKAQYVEKAKGFINKALVNSKDEMEVQIVLFYKGLIEKPKKATLKDLRFAVDILEALAERA